MRTLASLFSLMFAVLLLASLPLFAHDTPPALDVCEAQPMLGEQVVNAISPANVTSYTLIQVRPASVIEPSLLVVYDGTARSSLYSGPYAFATRTRGRCSGVGNFSAPEPRPISLL